MLTRLCRNLYRWASQLLAWATGRRFCWLWLWTGRRWVRFNTESLFFFLYFRKELRDPFTDLQIELHECGGDEGKLVASDSYRRMVAALRQFFGAAPQTSVSLLTDAEVFAILGEITQRVLRLRGRMQLEIFRADEPRQAG